MTAKELIDELSKVPLDAQVYYFDAEYGDQETTKVTYPRVTGKQINGEWETENSVVLS